MKIPHKQTLINIVNIHKTTSSFDKSYDENKCLYNHASEKIKYFKMNTGKTQTVMYIWNDFIWIVCIQILFENRTEQNRTDYLIGCDT